VLGKGKMTLKINEDSKIVGQAPRSNHTTRARALVRRLLNHYLWLNWRSYASVVYSLHKELLPDKLNDNDAVES